MRILLDNCMDVKYAALLADYDVTHAKDVNWQNLANGNLIAVAEDAGYDVIITIDKNMYYQQNIKTRKISIIVLLPKLTVFKNVEPLAPRVIATLQNVSAGSFVIIKPEKENL